LPTRTVTTMSTLNEKGRQIQLHVLGRGHTNGDLYIYLPKEKIVCTGDAVVGWMPFLNDGYPEDWVRTMDALGKLDFDHMILGHGDVVTKAHLAFFRGYLADLVEAVKKGAAAGASLDDLKQSVANQLAPKYEAGMSRYPVGQYRDRVGVNIEAVYNKTVKKG
jgi:glyoxylase-like metal-dependent hydrolase (beta-lactamase superfamily II)